MPAWLGGDRAIVPPISPEQSGLCGAVSHPTPGAPAPYAGRVEHLVSGQVRRFRSLEELLAFMIRVLTEVQHHGDAP